MEPFPVGSGNLLISNSLHDSARDVVWHKCATMGEAGLESKRLALKTIHIYVLIQELDYSWSLYAVYVHGRYGCPDDSTDCPAGSPTGMLHSPLVTHTPPLHGRTRAPTVYKRASNLAEALFLFLTIPQSVEHQQSWLSPSVFSINILISFIKRHLYQALPNIHN